MEYDVIEEGEVCRCNGDIDRLYLIDPNIWQGRCFVCGKRYNVIQKRLCNRKVG